MARLALSILALSAFANPAFANPTFANPAFASSTFANQTFANSVFANSTLALSTPPYPIAPDAALSEFRINIPEDDIQKLNAHLKLFSAPRSTYENSEVGWSLGVPKDWLVNTVDYWLNEFDWRKQENILNSVPQFKLALDDDDGESYSVHFAALFSDNKDAIPIIMSHGFPDSYMIYMPILQKLQAQYAATPDKLPYHFIVPSLIGTGFSSAPPLTKPFFTHDNARIWNKLMVALGFGTKGYIAEGHDVGTMISEYMLAQSDECKAAHGSLWWGNPPYNATKDLPANSLEEYTLEHIAETELWGQASVLLHANRPSTAGLSIGSSPISTLTWIGERMVLWADPVLSLTLDEILTNVAVYWFTGTYPTSYWVYSAFRSVPVTTQNTTILPTTNSSDETPMLVNKPLGFSWFPNEVDDPPKSYFDDYSDIFTNFYQHDQGGHFSPTTQPDVLWADIEDFVSKVWKS